MKLTLDRLDLLARNESMNRMDIQFEHFRFKVRTAIVVVGRATFWEYDKQGYNAISPTNFKGQDK